MLDKQTTPTSRFSSRCPDAVQQAVRAASWSGPGEQQQQQQPLPVDFSLHIERQPPRQEGGQQKRQRTGGGRPKREVVHVLLVLETTSGCRLGADVLLEGRDLVSRSVEEAFAVEQAARLVATLEVRWMAGFAGDWSGGRVGGCVVVCLKCLAQ